MPETFTIQEISEKADVSKHTLRFWEKTLNGIIVPLRTKGGQRRYTKYHLQLIEKIKKLKKNGLTLTDIKEKLETGNNRNGKSVPADKIDMLANQIAEVVKSSIVSFLSEDEGE